MTNFNISGLPEYQVFNDMEGVESFLNHLGDGNYVVKADGLMGGKGVKVAGEHLSSIAEAKLFCAEMITRQSKIIIEEKLCGQEFSLMCFCDGYQLIPMPIVQDHKRAYNGDLGPNTGGMGSYSDLDHSLPFLSPLDIQKAMNINRAIIAALNEKCGMRYIGILYGSFIATAKDIYVIEFNARFGDPEALNVLSILTSDFAAICQAMVVGSLADDLVSFAPLATVCKYAVPQGYPEAALKDIPIDISAVENKKQLYLASVDAVGGELLIRGSRTAAYVGVAHSIAAAETISENEIAKISGPLFHRTDIGTQTLIDARIHSMNQLRIAT